MTKNVLKGRKTEIKQTNKHNFSVAKKLKKCNPAEFKFYLGKVINKIWGNVYFGPVFFAFCIVYCSEKGDCQNQRTVKYEPHSYSTRLISQKVGQLF